MPIFGMILRLCTMRQTARFDIAARCSTSVGSVEKGYCIIRDSVPACSVLSYRHPGRIYSAAQVSLLHSACKGGVGCHEDEYAMRICSVMLTSLPMASLE